METGGLSNILVAVLGAISTLVIGGIGTFGAIFMRRMEYKAKMRELTGEVNRYVDWANGAESFKLMTGEEKKTTVLEKITQYAADNGISVTPAELAIMVEKSVQSLRQLETVGMKLMQLKSKQEK